MDASLSSNMEKTMKEMLKRDCIELQTLVEQKPGCDGRISALYAVYWPILVILTLISNIKKHVFILNVVLNLLIKEL